MGKIHELDVVRLTRDFPAMGLYKGDEGALVHIVGESYFVEFVAPDGNTIAMEAFLASALTVVWRAPKAGPFAGSGAS